jgi:hypothetical protein
LDQSLGALLLFVANVAAILATGVVVLSAYRIGSVARTPVLEDGATNPRGSWGKRNRAIITIFVTLFIIGIPLALTSVRFTDQQQLASSIRSAAQPWADQNGWQIADVQVNNSDATLTVTGTPPLPDTAALVAALTAEGVDPSQVTVEFIPAYEVHLAPAG